jgi:hypothetical protein
MCSGPHQKSKSYNLQGECALEAAGLSSVLVMAFGLVGVVSLVFDSVFGGWPSIAARNNVSANEVWRGKRETILQSKGVNTG